MADARTSLLANVGYYRKMLSGQAPLEAVEEPVETEIPEEE